MYGSIGYTRRDKTPAHWRKDYRLTQKAEKAIQNIKTEREALFKTFEALPLDTPDEEYTKAERVLTAKLNALIDQEDAIRRANPK